MPAPLIPRKWALHAHGRQVVFAKGVNESSEHVLMKALIWALYLPTFPDLTVEVGIGDRYKPDVVSLVDGVPRFWGEAGQVGVDKIETLCRRYPNTHFAWAKWDKRLDPYVDIVRRAQRKLIRTAPFDVIVFPTIAPRVSSTATAIFASATMTLSGCGWATKHVLTFTNVHFSYNVICNTEIATIEEASKRCITGHLGSARRRLATGAAVFVSGRLKPKASNCVCWAIMSALSR